MRVVIDTNVPVVANGQSKQASPECVKNCALRLNQLTKSGTLILDDKWRIIKEYQKNLRSSGQPGVGDAFLKWVLTNYQNPHCCELVKITPINSSDTEFEEFPSDPILEHFDPNDKKFIAVALGHKRKPPIWQAVDTKWWQMKGKLKEFGIKIDFLCIKDISQ